MRGKMYDEYEDYTVSYDYRDYDDEERGDWEPAEREEFSQCEDKEAFIKHVKKQTQKYGIRKFLPKPKSEPRDFADGLEEFVHSKTGGSIPEDCENDPYDKLSYAELQAEIDKRLLEEWNKPEYQEKVIQEAVEFYSNIPMYDFGLGKISNMHEISEFYGSDIMKRIEAEISESYHLPNDVRETGHISKELWKELRDLRAGRKTSSKSNKEKNSTRKCSAVPQNNEGKNTESAKKPKKKKPETVEVFQRERQKGDDYFMQRKRGIIRNRSYRELMKGPGTVYEWLWANLVRDEWIDTKGYPIKEKYYDKGLLAYCSSYRKIAKECGLHKNKVAEYIDNFREAGIIKVEHLIPDGKKRGQSVFILGEWKDANGELIERYFIDEIFLSEKNGQNMPN